MVNLLTEAAPYLILLDETLEYLNKALGMRAHDGNLAATTLTVKELCTAASNVRGAAIIATLTSSRLEDYATVAGEEMQERLSKVPLYGRTDTKSPMMYSWMVHVAGGEGDSTRHDDEMPAPAPRSRCHQLRHGRQYRRAGTGSYGYQQLSTKTDRVSVCKRGLVSTPILIHGYGRGGIGTTVTVTVGGCC
jgi:hypothetical protein